MIWNAEMQKRPNHKQDVVSTAAANSSAAASFHFSEFKSFRMIYVNLDANVCKLNCAAFHKSGSLSESRELDEGTSFDHSCNYSSKWVHMKYSQSTNCNTALLITDI